MNVRAARKQGNAVQYTYCDSVTQLKGRCDLSNHVFLSLLVACDDIRVTSNGTTIASPNFPQDYDNNVSCNYKAVAPVEHSVLLVFDTFSVEYEPSCLWDYVMVSWKVTEASFQGLPNPEMMTNL